ncbi:hypothetical protein B0T10DRAFT_418290 [Thelonectria olida]|uniref:F-box domain-containing protein n=1 Tax=Thelonectria olida TaxID=1576542 RepID=A0A9P8VRK6_9HYPO|nr:hypothetical protein B0T10DRAFT_418290 [Thelonectria olida]
METLPLEMVTEIARNLASTSDVRHFRLVSRAFAYAASPVLFWRVHAINTVGNLNQLRDFQCHPSNSAPAARHLTLYHGDWPALDSIDAWSQTPQALQQNTLPNHAKIKAYFAYRQFIDQEALRDLNTDISRFTGMLELFPNLTSLTISHIHAWRWGKLSNDHYHELSRNIHVVPFFKGWVGDLVQKLLPILYKSPRLKQLSVQGSLDLRGVEWTAVNRNILYLKVQSLITCESQEDQAGIFLRSFPNLQQLELGTEAGRWIREQKLPLYSLWWPDLWQVTFHNLWASEDELIDFIVRHQLQQLTLNNVTLFNGSWASFFDRTRNLPKRSLQSSECIMGTGHRVDLAEAATSCRRWPASAAEVLEPQVRLSFSFKEA